MGQEVDPLIRESVDQSARRCVSFPLTSPQKGPQEARFAIFGTTISVGHEASLRNEAAGHRNLLTSPVIGCLPIIGKQEI